MDSRIISELRKSRYELAALMAFVEVETGGKGFDASTGKILIQFEPVWFKRLIPYAPSGKWSVNKVEVQAKEWIAFNNAFAINQEAAMQSTSIGLGQIMGLHYKRFGYKTVGAMWDDAKTGIEAQVRQLVRFIDTDPKLVAAIKAHKWITVATIYNGAGYKALANQYGRTPYDKALANAYSRFKKQDIRL